MHIFNDRGTHLCLSSYFEYCDDHFQPLGRMSSLLQSCHRRISARSDTHIFLVVKLLLLGETYLQQWNMIVGVHLSYDGNLLLLIP